MLMTLSKSRSSSDTGSTPIHQIYITHCLHDEGVYRQAGFRVRAASTRDPLLMRFALEYPSYEAPAGSASAAEAPRRLALVRVPGGQSALIHSVYLPEDERGRANNFFSHVLLRPGLGPREALRTWDSSQWQAGCRSEDGTDLPPLDELPESAAVSDRAVTAFLHPTVTAGDDLASLTCPARLAGEPKRRRELVAQVLRGCLLALQARPSAARSRFFLLAEPGLTALLVYAAARLMPDSLAAELTFSTYENSHRDLRAYKHARVVGTYLADPSRGLEPEFFTNRGYALDTFGHRGSPELEAGGDRVIEEWIELAARGDWATVGKVHRLVGKSGSTVVPLQEAVLAAKVSRRLSAGRAGADDLLALKSAPWGAAVLDEHPDKVWPLVREQSLTDPRVRDAFADVVAAHLPELEQKAADALASDPPGEWQPSWRLLCAVLKDDPTRLRQTLPRVLPEPPYSSGLRLALLTELHRGQMSPVDPRQPWHVLLRGCSAEELGQFARAGLPAEWFARALAHALPRPDARAEAVRQIHAGDDDLVNAFWDQYRLMNDEGQRRVILGLLFPSEGPEGAAFLHRLLLLRRPMRVETLEWLLSAFKAFSREGAEFWGRDNHLGLLLDLLRGLGEAADPLWDRLCGMITPDVLPPGDPQQNAVLMELTAARDRPGPALPRRTVQVIDDWILLRDHFEKATDVPESGRRAVIDACNRLRFDSVDVLCRYFARYILPQGTNRAVLDDFVGFFHSFFRAGMEHHDYSSRLIAWLQIVSGCADEGQRADYQRYYLENHIPSDFRARLAEEAHEAGRLLPAAFEPFRKGRPAAAPSPAPVTLGSAPTSAPALPAKVPPSSDVGPAADPPVPFWRGLGGRGSGILVVAVGGLLAAGLFNLYRIPSGQMPLLLSFLPLILLVVEGVSVQGLPGSSSPARTLGRELLTCLLLGLGAALLASCVMAAFRWPVRVRVCVGGAIVGGVMLASLAGAAVPGLLRALRCDKRIAAAPVARTLAVVGAVFLYVSLARWMLR